MNVLDLGQEKVEFIGKLFSQIKISYLIIVYQSIL